MTKRAGFTLLELLVVISIIGILASIIYVSFTDARQDARNKAMQVELKEVQLAIETYRSQNDTFPLPNPNCDTADGGELYATDNGCTENYISGLIPEFTDLLPSSDESANAACDIEYRTDTFGTWYKLTAINCLAGVDSTSGLTANEPLARCSNVCSNTGSGEVCDDTDADYFESFAVYSLGGQCE